MTDDLRSGLHGFNESILSGLGDKRFGVPWGSSAAPSFDCWKTSYTEPTCDRYVWNAFGSTGVMFVRVTGGISRDDGGLYPVAAAEACGVKPVRTIGGWRRVEIATDETGQQLSRLILAHIQYTILSRLCNGAMLL